MPIDYKLYHPDWKNISVRIRFERAKNRCEWCNAENYKPHPKTGSKVILTVAHINQNKDDNREENLAALCQRCHLNHDRRKHISNRLNNRLNRYHFTGTLF
jgi:16S rRNA A1518/A1519 N6-dimethyltransferase RsmA/KsgA/DIM1 with predicted DNA glycosylase/AP lyase activity